MHLDSTFLTTFVVIAGLLITGSTIWASFRSTRNTQATALYRDTAAGWEAKSKLQDEQMTEMKADYARQLDDLRASEADKDAKIADLNARVDVLQDMVTGRSLLEEHHRAFETQSAAILAIAEATRNEVRAMHVQVSSLAGRAPA
jgi:cell division protein FtsB